jgi:PPOX class probable F420-dependent enzyme
MSSIPEKFHDLLKNETRAFLFLATVMDDGSPQVTPVWFDYDDGHIRINTAEGRVKDRNMRSRPSVAVCIADPRDGYRYIQIRGRVIERTYEGADAHIDALNHKYRGDAWKLRPGQVRVIYKIQPEKIDASDG